MAGDGLDADTLFNQACMGYGLDDVIALPGHAVATVEDLDLSAQFSRHIRVCNPLVAAPMDTVCESRMAIAMALLGGIGVVHCNCSVEEQARQVAKVKAFENGFIMDPHVLSPASTLADYNRIKEDYDCSTVVITDGGNMGHRLLGIVTSRDVDFEEHRDVTLGTLMTPVDRLDVAKEPISLKDAHNRLRASRKGKLPIVNEAGDLVALVVRSDLKRIQEYPSASKDANRQLLVAAAVSPKPSEAGRVLRLVEAGADAIVLDAMQGSTPQQIDFLKRVKSEYPSIDVICGNVVTPRQAKPLLDAGADGLRVGMGCSSLCSTFEGLAVGRPQASAVYHVARLAREFKCPVIADGGVQNAHQAAMALTLGASCVMCGSLLAGTREAPGEGFYHGGMRLKLYRGMGALDVELGQSETRRNPAMAPEQACLANGVGWAVVDRGSVTSLLPNVMDGIRRQLRQVGAATIQALHDDLYDGGLRFQSRAPAVHAAITGAVP